MPKTIPMRTPTVRGFELMVSGYLKLTKGAGGAGVTRRGSARPGDRVAEPVVEVRVSHRPKGEVHPRVEQHLSVRGGPWQASQLSGFSNGTGHRVEVRGQPRDQAEVHVDRRDGHSALLDAG